MAAAPLLVPLITTAASIGFSSYQSSQQARAQQLQYDQQRALAEAQAAAELGYQEELVDDNERQMQENEARAIQHYNFQNLSEDLRLLQLKSIMTEDSTDLHRQGLQARGRAAAAASTAGATGQSVELVLKDIRAQEGQQRSKLEHQFELEQQGSAQRRRGFGIELEQNRSAVQPYIPGPIFQNQPIAPSVSPSGAAALGGLQAGLNAGSTFGLEYWRSSRNLGAS